MTWRATAPAVRQSALTGEPSFRISLLTGRTSSQCLHALRSWWARYQRAPLLRRSTPCGQMRVQWLEDSRSRESGSDSTYDRRINCRLQGELSATLRAQIAPAVSPNLTTLPPNPPLSPLRCPSVVAFASLDTVECVKRFLCLGGPALSARRLCSESPPRDCGQQFSHRGDDGDLSWFTCGSEPLSTTRLYDRRKTKPGQSDV
jgi:hypothetical protein